MQEGKLTESKADDFKLQIQLPRIILNISMIVLLVLSGNKNVPKQLINNMGCIFIGVITLWMAALLGRWYFYKREKLKKISHNPSINDSPSSSLLINDSKPYQSI